MKKIITIIIFIAILIIFGYLILKSKVSVPALETANQELSLVDATEEKIDTESETAVKKNEENNTKDHEVIYTDSGYFPKEIKIKLGDSVTWKNQSSGGSWVGSAMHPTHIIYSGTSLQEHCPDLDNVTFDECKSSQPGESWTFKFNKKGTWRYHNHVKASHSGSVTVE